MKAKYTITYELDDEEVEKLLTMLGFDMNDIREPDDICEDLLDFFRDMVYEHSDEKYGLSSREQFTLEK